MTIRPETEQDRADIRAVNEAAFETPAEANLVDALRDEARPVVSLVADHAGTIVGHILLSPVTLAGRPETQIAGLGPMAVLPGHQRRGIGASLVLEGLVACEKLGFGAVVVLGHADYYPRFGFVPGAWFGLSSEYDVPDDVFMARELRPGYLGGATGTIRYHPAFGAE
jgi:putative acetyltransferase